MTISISEQSYQELFHKTQTNIQTDPTDELDIVWQYPKLLGQGKIREIQLRDGLCLEILDCRLRDRIVIKNIESWECLRFHFHLYGHHQDYDTTVNDREFALYGSGYNPKHSNHGSPQTALEVTLNVAPETLLSFVGDRGEQLPQEIEHLIKPEDKIRYARVGKVTPVLEGLLWQILRCPYQGITKRIYLESKALELISLVIEQEREIKVKKRSLKALKPGTIERIHDAKTILLQNLDCPPSISDLAKQVKLNEYTLKRGFRYCFNTTIFRYLHDYRLEQAKQLLETGEMGVAEVMNAVEFCDRHHFAAAFRKKYQTNPRDYLMQYKRG
jgi:AraC-like DNA-binding protein